MTIEPPFPRSLQLNHDPPPSDTNPSHTIPGHCSLPLRLPTIISFLHEELDTPILNDLYPYLPFIARKSPGHIDPLHHHLIKGRKILVAESPELHLVWWYDVVYLKPIPVCLGNWGFWRAWMCHRENGQCLAKMVDEKEREPGNWCPLGAAYGFLRTYAFLIRHPSDFRIAVESGLLPEGVDWPSFSQFIAKFRGIHDDVVSPRYHYGQLRLTRLNWAVRLLRPKSASGAWNYHEMYWQTGQYLESYFRPLMFVFGSVTVLLSAVQVVVSIPVESGRIDGGGRAFARASWGVSIVVIMLVVLIWVAVLGGIFCLILAQLTFSIKQMRRQ